jgi:hypothetical protein
MSADFTLGDFYCRVRRARAGRHRYVAWAARTPELGNGPLEVPFAEDCYFEFGDSVEEAMERLSRDLKKHALQ